MTKTMFATLLSIIFLLLITFSVSAELTATIGNPKMVLYKNITAGDSLKFQNSVVVENKNNFPAQITITPQGVWKDKVSLIDSEFTLPEGERREVNYTIDLSKSPTGYYRGDVLVIFEGGDEANSLSLAQDIAVVVYGESQEESKLNYGIIFAIILIIILVALIIIFANKKSPRRKK
jgi:hypothetical protein